MHLSLIKLTDIVIAPGAFPSGGCSPRATQTSFMAQCTEGKPRRMTVPAGGLPRHRALTDSLGVFEMDVEVSVHTGT